MPQEPRRQSGQSLVESCIIICLIGVIFAGLYQIARLFAAREIMYHAAARGARAKAVGFNWWMVEKSIRVAAIPNAGRLTVPEFQNRDQALESLAASSRPGALWMQVLGIVPSSLQLRLEMSRIPEYLDSDNHVRGGYILDYQDWDTVVGDHEGGMSVDDSGYGLLRVRTVQDFPLTVPLHRAFYAADTIRIVGESELIDHASLYIQDMGW